MRNARDHLARRVISDILVRPAGARGAGRAKLVKACAEEAWILSLLQLIVIGIAVKAEPVRQQVTDTRLIFVAGRKLEVGRVIGDRRIEINLALFRKLCDHRRRDALRAGRPAKYCFRRDRVAGTGERLTITLEEGDPAVLDHADRQTDHGRLGH